MSPASIRLLVLVLIFAATLLAVEGVIRWVQGSRKEGRAINRRLQLIQRGMNHEQVMTRIRREVRTRLPVSGPLGALAGRIDQMVVEAGMTISSANLIVLLAGSTAALFVVSAGIAAVTGMTMSLGGLLLIVLFATSLGIALPLMAISHKREKRRRRLTEQFSTALDTFVRSLRAGHPIAAALELLTTDMADPIGSEFGIVVDEVTYGSELRDALQNMADRCGVEDMKMFVVSVSVQRETGGNLAEILDNLSTVIRERASMMLKVRALSSEGRISGMMLTALPVLTFTLVFLSNPGFYLDVANDPVFFPGFGMLLGLYAVGVYSIRRMVDLKV